MKKLFLISIALSWVFSSLNAADVSGDYRSYQTGSWNDAANWEKFNGTSWVYPASEFPTLNGLSRKVTIRANHTITATGNITTNSSTANITVEENGVFEAGSYFIRGGSTSSRFNTVVIEGTLNTANYISAANFTVASTGYFNTSYAGNSGWWLSGISPTSVTLDGTVEFSGGSGQRVPGRNFTNIIISSAGQKDLVEAVNVSENIVVESGATLSVDAVLNIEGTLSIEGEVIAGTISNITVNNVDIFEDYALKLKSDNSGTASFIVNGEINGASGASGETEIDLFLTGGGEPDDTKWHYISSPISSLPVSTFTGNTNNVAQFIESYPSTTLLQGWVAYDGYIYMGGTGPTFSALTPGKGYDYYDTDDYTYTFSGNLNNSNVQASLAWSGSGSLFGFNLVGNPFPSGLNWDDIVNESYYSYPSNTSEGIYFTRDDKVCSYIGGIGIPEDVTGVVPPMQGFFTKTYSSGNTITFPLGARTHDNIHDRYKKGSAIIPHVRLKLKKKTTILDETVVRFSEFAKTGPDLKFDAMKLFGSTSRPQIVTSAEGLIYSINGQPFPETSAEYPVLVNLIQDTTYTISATQLQGLDNYYVTLKDNLTGIVTDLKTSPNVSFTALSGSLADRFVLKVSTTATAIEDPLKTENNIVLYSDGNNIVIRPVSDEWDARQGSLKVLDILGRTVTSIADQEFSRDADIRVPHRGISGIYIVELRSGLKRHTGKVVVR